MRSDIILVLLVTSLFAGAMDVRADDHGSDYVTATAIAVNTDVSGNIEISDDTDWFSVPLIANHAYVITTTLPLFGLADSQLYLYSSNGSTQLAYNDDDGGSYSSRIEYTIAGSATYFVMVKGYGSNTGAYTVRVEDLGGPEGDAFTDVTTDMGLTALYSPAATDNAAAWGDYDNDGWLDLYLGTYDAAKGVYLFKNNGGTGFTQPFTASSGNFTMWWPGLFVDFDNDGDADLYSAMASGHLSRNNGGSFADSTGLLQSFTWQSECSAWADFNNDGWLDFYRTGWETDPDGPYFPDAIFMSNAGASFSISWWQETAGDWKDGVGDRRAGRGVTCADFDEDHDMDIYVSNYRLAPNYLWVNNGSGSFTDQALTYGVAGIDEGVTSPYAWGHTISSAWGDLDNDGHLDLVVGNFSHAYMTGGVYYQDPVKFYKNLGSAGNWHFQEMVSFDVNGPDWVQSYASPALADFDNDGDLDVFIAAASGAGYTGERSRFYRNEGNWTFTNVSVGYGLSLATAETNFQAAWGDYENDGDLDLFTGRKLYRNNMNNGKHWLNVILRGDGVAVNRQAVGAQVRIAWGGQTLTRQVETATGWGNQNDPRLHFGLGTDAGPIPVVTIVWPNGESQTAKYVAVDQTITVDYHPDALTAARDWAIYK
jgi:hypothetical protein